MTDDKRLSDKIIMSFPSIHEAFQFQGSKDKKDKDSKSNVHGASQMELQPPPPPKQGDQMIVQQDNGRYPSDASNSNYPVKVRCQRCRAVSITRMNSELGAASWVWCVLLSPFACIGLSCLCIQSCRDKVHLCNRCGEVVGKKHAKVC